MHPLLVTAWKTGTKVLEFYELENDFQLEIIFKLIKLNNNLFETSRDFVKILLNFDKF